MTRYAQELLTACLVAKGFGLDDAKSAVAFMLSAAVTAEIIEVRHLENWERNASIYRLRGRGMTAPALSERFGIDRSKIFEAIRRHAKLRRAALRDNDSLDLAG